jgi:hypothetical protein
MLQQVGSAVARTRAVTGIVFAGGFALVFLVVTVRLASRGAWVEAAVAAAFVAALAWQVRRWVRQLRAGTF